MRLDQNVRVALAWATLAVFTGLIVGGWAVALATEETVHRARATAIAATAEASASIGLAEVAADHAAITEQRNAELTAEVSRLRAELEASAR